MTTSRPANLSPLDTTDAAELALQLRTDALFADMAEVARENCSHLFEEESEADDEIGSSIAHWEALASEALEMAAWDEAHVGSGAAQRAKAQLFKRTAEALRLEQTTGAYHCVCCLKPQSKPLNYWQR